MPGAKLPILTITNKQYFRDDGLYIYSSTDGQLDIIADTTAKITAPTCELEGAITLDGTTTIDTGHYMAFSNDGVSASGLKGVTIWSGSSFAGSGSAGWIRVNIGGLAGYIPVLSGSLPTT